MFRAKCVLSCIEVLSSCCVLMHVKSRSKTTLTFYPSTTLGQLISSNGGASEAALSRACYRTSLSARATVQWWWWCWYFKFWQTSRDNTVLWESPLFVWPHNCWAEKVSVVVVVAAAVAALVWTWEEIGSHLSTSARAIATTQHSRGGSRSIS